jgi:hypothetical protein
MMAAVSVPSPVFVARAFVSPSWCGCALLSFHREHEFAMSSSFCGRKSSSSPSWGFVCWWCYWVAFLVVVEDGDARSSFPLPSPK